jgi:hypothetical protein
MGIAKVGRKSTRTPAHNMPRGFNYSQVPGLGPGGKDVKKALDVEMDGV